MKYGQIAAALACLRPPLAARRSWRNGDFQFSVAPAAVEEIRPRYFTPAEIVLSMRG